MKNVQLRSNKLYKVAVRREHEFFGIAFLYKTSTFYVSAPCLADAQDVVARMQKTSNCKVTLFAQNVYWETEVE